MSTDVMLIANRPQRGSMLSGVFHNYGYRAQAIYALDEALQSLESGSQPAIIVIDMLFSASMTAAFIRAVRSFSSVGIVTVGYDCEDAAGCLSLPRTSSPDMIVEAVHMFLGA
jgi:CheY-like chemotaxis protein